MRNMEFKMERQGLLTVGQEVDVTESALPTSYYYTIQPMIAMSKNYPGYERLQSRKGIVKDIKETDRGIIRWWNLMRRISGTDTGDSLKDTENKKNIPNKTECSFFKICKI